MPKGFQPTQKSHASPPVAVRGPQQDALDMADADGPDADENNQSPTPTIVSSSTRRITMPMTPAHSRMPTKKAS